MPQMETLSTSIVHNSESGQNFKEQRKYFWGRIYFCTPLCQLIGKVLNTDNYKSLFNLHW